MSEISGAHTLGTPDTVDLDSVGITLPGVQTKIIYLDDEKTGEVIFLLLFFIFSTVKTIYTHTHYFVKYSFCTRLFVFIHFL